MDCPISGCLWACAPRSPCPPAVTGRLKIRLMNLTNPSRTPLPPRQAHAGRWARPGLARGGRYLGVGPEGWCGVVSRVGWWGVGVGWVPAAVRRASLVGLVMLKLPHELLGFIAVAAPPRGRRARDPAPPDSCTRCTAELAHQAGPRVPDWPGRPGRRPVPTCWMRTPAGSELAASLTRLIMEQHDGPHRASRVRVTSRRPVVWIM